MKEANYIVNQVRADKMIIQDVGPWDEYMTITNAAEWVIEDLSKHYNMSNRRLFYFDSEGGYSEILIKNGKFAGFKYAEKDSWENE